MNPLGPLYSVEFVLLIVALVFYYKVADIEDAPRWLWMGLSAGVYLFTWQVLHWGFIGCLLGQVGLFLGIAMYRVLRDQIHGIRR